MVDQGFESSVKKVSAELSGGVDVILITSKKKAEEWFEGRNDVWPGCNHLVCPSHLWTPVKG